MYLSIILTYFKKKKYIKRTLNSIIGQSFNKQELIIDNEDQKSQQMNIAKSKIQT